MDQSIGMQAVPREVLRQVKLIELRTRGLVNTLFSGEYHSVFKGQGMEFAEVREYAPGDEYRTIDWNVSARMGHPYVKKYKEERELTVLFAVDLSGSAQFGTRGIPIRRGGDVDGAGFDASVGAEYRAAFDQGAAQLLGDEAKHRATLHQSGQQTARDGPGCREQQARVAPVHDDLEGRRAS